MAKNINEYIYIDGVAPKSCKKKKVSETRESYCTKTKITPVYGPNYVCSPYPTIKRVTYC
jgi:hypothetical protein